MWITLELRLPLPEASSSIALNTAEGAGRWDAPTDRKRFFRMALGIRQLADSLGTMLYNPLSSLSTRITIVLKFSLSLPKQESSAKETSMATVHATQAFLASILLFGTMAIGCVPQNKATPNIVGGSFSEPNTAIYNATVSLDADGIPYCTGALFDSRTIITAAHCIKGSPPGKALSIGFGSARTKNKASIPFESYSQAQMHPQWDSRDMGSATIDPMPHSPKNDIAIIVLGQVAPSWAKPIPLKMIGNVKLGEKTLLAGFGQTKNQDSNGFNPHMEFRGELRQVDAVIDTINDKGFEFIVKPTAQNPMGSSCHGDSGGPMYFYDSDGKFTLIGITSRSYSKEEDCRGRSVYTDARKFEPWILQTRDELIKKQGPSSEEWQHRYIDASDGTKIAIDYQLASAGVQKVAKEIWVNITRPSFVGNENVSVEVNSYVNSLSKSSGSLQYAQNGRFTLRLSELEGQVVCTPYSRWGVQQSISIRVNEKVIPSNETRSDEFSFKFCES
jgi:hypothetical protein